MDQVGLAQTLRSSPLSLPTVKVASVMSLRPGNGEGREGGAGIAQALHREDADGDLYASDAEAGTASAGESFRAATRSGGNVQLPVVVM
jgi:hypothetical protein